MNFIENFRILKYSDSGSLMMVMEKFKYYIKLLGRGLMTLCID
ncbi:MAG: hypothetical protein QXP91_11570 [Candidatus Methanomethylicia archaeon]